MNDNEVRIALGILLDLGGRNQVRGLRSVATLIQGEVAGEFGENGLPKHVPIGVNEFGHGPLAEDDPDYVRTVCWCMDSDCARYLRPPQWFSALADWLIETADDLEGRGVTARVRRTERAAFQLAKVYVAAQIASDAEPIGRSEQA